MITEDQFEQLAIQWFQDTGWSYVNGKVIWPEGEAAERESRGNIEHPSSRCYAGTSRTPNIRLRLGYAGQVERRMEENLELPKIGAGIGKGIDAAFRGGCRPFRAWNPVGDGTQGASLGYRMMPRWGGRGRRGKTALVRNNRATGKRYLQVRIERSIP